MVNESSGHDDALSRDDVRAAYEDDPTWALLRSYNSRWMLPLFSRHLEHAEGPVSADWFHQRVAVALERNAAEQAEQQASAAQAGEHGTLPEEARVASTADPAAPGAPAPHSPDAAAPDPAAAPDARTTPADYCRSWVDSRWLIRTRASSEDGDGRGDDGGRDRTGGDSRARYRLSPHALKALRIVRELVEQDNAVSEARLGSIAHAVGQLAGLADPSRDAQVARLDEQIAELQRRRDQIEQHGTEPVSPDVLKRQVREVVRLTASLPEDFRQLSQMVEQRHRLVARSASMDHVGKGALVEQYLRENDLLEQTPEGRAYRGFAQMLSSREIDVMRADIDAILSHPAAARHLTDRQRTQLESLISSLLAEEQSVQETYGRWTSSLRRFLSRTSAERHQRLLTLAERALHAGGVWAERRPGPATMPEDVLGLGALDVVDISQAQLHSDRGRPTVDVTVSDAGASLPAADRAALRLTSGTSTAAVSATLDRLLLERDEVTSADVYEATEPEFRRLGLVLSMLDLALDRGAVDDETETVTLSADDASPGGAGRRVTLPRLVFRRHAAPDDAAAPAPAPTPALAPHDPKDPA
ncbi:hypothetical protein FFA01_17220 [Frigoribacterium faeni]|uniref:DUF3375 domain-containing protein n=1 Tax=Frigoribacterium faeni TaxID=145483 RepID=A0ABQ0UPK1_9MICO|nr:hypothetical protein GCM10025699_55950 [Microbacterium flavescens]GEK83413.1 hypothetical protein FFA01_17220 [Frigoribacterium faeni]